MEIAGYAHDNAAVVEKTKLFQELWAEYQELCNSLELDVATRIRDAQKASGFCAANNLKVLQSITTRVKAKDRDKISAIKEGTTITGERMPEQIDHNITGDEELLSKIMSN